jgi:hypothetical protein
MAKDMWESIVRTTSYVLEQTLAKPITTNVGQLLRKDFVINLIIDTY